MIYLIGQAIEQKRLLQFIYKDETRIVEPHLVGCKNSGKDALSAYLVGGYTESEREPYWRNYSVDKMEAVTILDQTFDGARPGYNPNDETMSEIYYRL